MFTLVDGRVYCYDVKLASKSYILETEELDNDIVFETWFEEVDGTMTSATILDFEDTYNKDWAPSVFREMAVSFSKEG